MKAKIQNIVVYVLCGIISLIIIGNIISYNVGKNLIKQADYDLIGDSKNEKVKNLARMSFTDYFNKRYDTSIAYMEDALRIEPENRALIYHYGRLKFKNTDKSGGLLIMQKISNGNDKFAIKARHIIKVGDDSESSF